MKNFLACVLSLLASPAFADGTVVLLDLPCKILDTRVSIGQVAANGQLNFEVRGDAGSGQGGETGCGAPAGSTGAFISVAAIEPSADGFARVWGYGRTQPTAAVLSLNQDLTRNDNMLVALGGGSYDLSLYTTATAHYVVSLVGYVQPEANAFTAVGTVRKVVTHEYNSEVVAAYLYVGVPVGWETWVTEIACDPLNKTECTPAILDCVTAEASGPHGTDSSITVHAYTCAIPAQGECVRLQGHIEADANWKPALLAEGEPEILPDSACGL